MDAAVSPLFAVLLGPAFATLPELVRALHVAQGRRRYAGEVEVDRIVAGVRAVQIQVNQHSQFTGCRAIKKQTRSFPLVMMWR